MAALETSGREHTGYNHERITVSHPPGTAPFHRSNASINPHPRSSYSYTVIGANGNPPNASIPSLHVKSTANTGAAAATIVATFNFGATAMTLGVS
ncbi:unnamed protein product [Diplocarpon coronariae]